MGLHEQLRAPGLPETPNVIVVAASRPPASYRNRGKFWGDPDTGAVAFSTGEEWVSGALGAPTNASYLVIATHADLTAERALVFGTGFTVADGGAGANYAIVFTPVNFTTVTPAADDFVVISDTSDSGTARKALVSDLGAYFSPPNVLVNGGQGRWARGTASAAYADDAYAADAWYVLTQTASITAQRTTGDANSPYACRLTQTQAAAQRFGYAHAAEAADSAPLAGKSVRFQARVRISNSQAVRVAVLEWTGTADSVTSDVVNDWTSGTYTAGNFFLASDLTVAAAGSATPAANTWATIGLNATLSSSCKNVIVLVWTEGTAAQNVTLDLTELYLFRGTGATDWTPRANGDDQQRCERLVWAVEDNASSTTAHAGVGYAATTTTGRIFVYPPTEMRKEPAITVTVTDWDMSDGATQTTLTNLTLGAVNSSTRCYQLTITVAAGLTQFRPYSLRANNAGKRMVFSAEL
jgi:hypothetical protein